MAYSCPAYVTDRSGRRWPNLQYVRGECEDHWLPRASWIDGPMLWDSQMRPKGPTAVALRGVPEGELAFMRSAGFTPSCDLPSLAGLAMYSAAGALATPRRRMQGALNGLWGGWVGCAISRALGVGDAMSVVLTLGGAYFVARTFRS